MDGICKWLVDIKRQIHFPACKGTYLFKALILHKGNTSFYLDFLANWYQAAQIFSRRANNGGI